MPQHWKERSKDAWFQLRLLATGQALQLRENLRQLARETTRFWPEYSELQCFACHHVPAGPKGNWRQESAYPGRRPGNPAWNASRYTIFKLILDTIDADDARRVDNAMLHVNSLVSDITADRRQIAAAAQESAELVDQIGQKLTTYPLDSQSAVRIMQQIGAAGDWISLQGERSAEQAAMVLNSVVVQYCDIVKPGPAVKKEMTDAVAGLFQLLENPPAYTPKDFGERMRAFRKLLSE